jgi:hypothetical protein
MEQPAPLLDIELTAALQMILWILTNVLACNVGDGQQLEQSTLPSRPRLTMGDEDQHEKSVVFVLVRASMPCSSSLPKERVDETKQSCLQR